MGFSVEPPRTGSVAPIRGLVSFGTLTQGLLRFALGFIPSSASSLGIFSCGSTLSQADEVTFVFAAGRDSSRLAGVPTLRLGCR